MDQKQVIRWN